MNIHDESGRFQLKLQPADTFIRRLLGLMFKLTLPDGQGLLLTPCSSIHTCFMRFAIDVIYLNSSGQVLAIETIAPWRVGKRVAGTKMIVETAEGGAAKVKTGTNLVIDQT